MITTIVREDGFLFDYICIYLFIIVSRRLIDFHLTLLKRISLGKGAQRDKFVPIITKVRLRG